MQCWGAKSFADDLVTGRGVVLSRAATTLRSVETKPMIGRFVFFTQFLFSRTHYGGTCTFFLFRKFCLAVPT